MQGRLRTGGSGAWMFDCVATAIESRPLPPERHRLLRQRMLSRVVSHQQSSVTVRRAEGEWQALAPGVSIKLLRRDPASGNMTAYIRMSPGTTIEAHAHTQDEECLLLEGEIFIGRHRLAAGDMHVARAGTTHEVIQSPRGALMLV